LLIEGGFETRPCKSRRANHRISDVCWLVDWLAGGLRGVGFGAAFLGFGFGGGLSLEEDAAGVAAAGAPSFAFSFAALFFLGFGFDSADAAPGTGGFVPV
jgi:hypothetical protein